VRARSDDACSPLELLADDPRLGEDALVERSVLARNPLAAPHAEQGGDGGQSLDDDIGLEGVRIRRSMPAFTSTWTARGISSVSSFADLSPTPSAEVTAAAARCDPSQPPAPAGVDRPCDIAASWRRWPPAVELLLSCAAVVFLFRTERATRKGAGNGRRLQEWVLVFFYSAGGADAWPGSGALVG
jgi:hypothetical protein